MTDSDGDDLSVALARLRSDNERLSRRIAELERRVDDRAATTDEHEQPDPPGAPSRRFLMSAGAAAVLAGVLGANTEPAAAATDVVPRDEGNLDGTMVPVWQASSRSGSTARFTASDTAAFTGAGQTVHDPVLYLGWNVQSGSALIDNTRGAAFIAIEGDYWTDNAFDGEWHHQTEFHIESKPPYDPGEWARRVFSSLHAWHTHETITMLHGDTFLISEGGPGVRDDTEQRQIFGWTPGGHVFVNRSRVVLADPHSGSAGVDLMLNVDANTPGSLSFIHLASHDDGDAGIYWDDDVEGEPSRWLLHRNHGSGLELWDARNVRTHATFDAPTPTTASTTFAGRTTLQAEAGQTGPVLEIRDTEDRAVFAVYPDGSMHPAPGAFSLLGVPVRIFDSRVTGGKFVNETRVVDLAASAKLPAGASGLVANLAVTGTSAGGYVSLWRAGVPWPGTSSLNWSGGPNQTISSSAATALDANGRIQCKVVGTAHVIIDVVGVTG